MNPPSAPADVPRLAVLVSGNGSNLQAILDACAEGRLAAHVAVVIANNPDAYALTRAAEAGVPTEVRPHQGVDRAEYDKELAYTAATYGADLVVLAGWNRILTTFFVGHHATINLHPAKPGGFRGLGAIEADFAAWQRGDLTEGGVMVHYVPDEGVDDGPVIAWEGVPFHDGDTLDDYALRVHGVEHRLLVDAIATVLARADTLGGHR
ncbi:MAG: phosphoribosylglycinamide formyltransferase [Actinomycetota bacterium]